MTFDITRINDAIQDTQFQGRLHHFPIIDSTNTRALADAHTGIEAGQVYIADEQTAGRGRGGHTWHSEPDRGLYLTVLVRPRLHSNKVLNLSLATGIAAAQAIREVTAHSIDIRWPNDLVVPQANGPSLKLGGILTEAAATPDGTIRHAAIGIGINLNQAEFPQDLQSTATSLRIAFGALVSREALAIALLRHLHAELLSLNPDESNGLYERFESCSTWTRDKRVHVAEDEGYTGTTAGLTADGLLRIHCDDGFERVVRHGGVREL
jgi:BirA family biotin operon repressor/biotin-[acetyl-CoA-carboxylase] ligase